MAIIRVEDVTDFWDDLEPYRWILRPLAKGTIALVGAGVVMAEGASMAQKVIGGAITAAGLLPKDRQPTQAANEQVPLDDLIN